MKITIETTSDGKLRIISDSAEGVHTAETFAVSANIQVGDFVMRFIRADVREKLYAMFLDAGYRPHDPVRCAKQDEPCANSQAGVAEDVAHATDSDPVALAQWMIDEQISLEFVTEEELTEMWTMAKEGRTAPAEVIDLDFLGRGTNEWLSRLAGEL